MAARPLDVRAVIRKIRDMRRGGLAAIPVLLAGCQVGVDLSAERWSDDYERFMQAQLVDRTAF